MARAGSNTFAGIRPADVPGFILAELLGAACVTTLFAWLIPISAKDAGAVVLPHPNAGLEGSDW